MFTEYKLIRSKRKTVALIVATDATLVVRAPLRMPVLFVEKIISAKQDWIKKSIDRIKSRPLPTIKKFTSGEKFLYLGNEYTLAITALEHQPFFDNNFYLPYSQQATAKLFFEQWYKNQARSIFTSRVATYAAEHKLRYQRVRITSAKRRWGSCSGANLNFNWRLVMAPLFIIDYVIAHELAHLEFKNHSREFWMKVNNICPESEAAKRWLKLNGNSLKI